MKKVWLSLFCLSLLFPRVRVLASPILTSSLTSEQKETLKSTTSGSVLLLTTDNVKMLKSVSQDFIILTFSEDGGFSSDTYNSVIGLLSIILSPEHLSYFQGQYPGIKQDAEISFTGFRLRMNPTRTASEIQYFDERTNIFRVEICIHELDDITPTPTPPVVPSQSPTPTNPGATDVTNPPTGDISPSVLLIGTILASLGAYISIKQILLSN